MRKFLKTLWLSRNDRTPTHYYANTAIAFGSVSSFLNEHGSVVAVVSSMIFFLLWLWSDNKYDRPKVVGNSF